MKRLILAMIAVLIVSALVACSSSDGSNNDKQYSSLVSDTQSKQSSESLAAFPTLDSSSAEVSSDGKYVFGSTEAELRKTVSKEDIYLFDKLKSADAPNIKSEMYYFIAGDFDFDGEKESIGAFNDDDGSQNMFNDYPKSSIRYFDNNEVSYILGRCSGMGYCNLQTFVINERTLIKIEDAYVSESLSQLFWVTKDKLILSQISGLQGFNPCEYGGYTMLHSVYDATTDIGGHTWKPYWFYYDKTIEDFCEYGGIDVSYQNISKVDGFNEVKAVFPTGSEFVNAIYRENGIVNVNYRLLSQIDGETFYQNYNCTATLNDGKLKTLDNTVQNGIYLTNVSEKATFPKSFQHNNKK